ncbi:MAG: hypothetical protein ACNI3C_00320 [Candidatus Marinarcus sp.]|uniref:hypothetical protein n=1 Tax=Candidatus Marinarcus sp. TaxID=3100987 RepID=UPI003AFF6FC8
MSESTHVKSISLAHHFGEDKINVTHVEKPHGDYSDPVVKLDINEFGKIAGEVEIPYENIDALILALQKAKEVYNEIVHVDVHAQMNAAIGGGE